MPYLYLKVALLAFSRHILHEYIHANILTLGQRVVGPGLALDIVKTFLNTEFEGGRHQNRIDKIEEIEKSLINKKIK